MKEMWKDIEGYEDLYQISSYGRIKSKDRIIQCSNNRNRRKYGQILKPFISRSGYYAITLWNNKKFKLNYIHRLVASAFLENTYNKEQVNHIDGNKFNNRIDNLEWATRSENQKHSHRIGLISYETMYEMVKKMREKVIKKVYQIKDGKIIAEYESVVEAGKQFSKYACNNISTCALGKLKSAYGYQWKYKD